MNAKIARLDLAPPDPRIEDYLAGRLDATSLQRFELDMIASLELQAQVRDAYALRELVRSQPGQLELPRRAQHVRLPLALAAGLGALAAGIPGAWWAHYQLQAQSQLSTEVGVLQQQLDALGQVQVGLPVIHLGPLRSLQDEAVPLLRKRHDVAWVQLSIPPGLLGDMPMASRRLSLLGPAGHVMELTGSGSWSVDESDGSVLLPLTRLQPGTYRLLVEADGASALAFPFEVLAEQVD